MEIEVRHNKFWYLEDNKNSKKWIFDEEKNAISRLKDLISKNIPTEKLNLQIMECSPDNLELKPVSWQKIATELIKK